MDNCTCTNMGTCYKRRSVVFTFLITCAIVLLIATQINVNQWTVLMVPPKQISTKDNTRQLLENTDTTYYQSESGEDSFESDIFKFENNDFDNQTNLLNAQNNGRNDTEITDSDISMWFEGGMNRPFTNVNLTSHILDMDPIEFLPNYRNPCWIENLEKSNPYELNVFRIPKTWTEIYERRLTDNTTRPFRIRCIPYFYIVGFPKCGTTDLYKKLHEHPLLEPGLQKETHYWTRRRYGDGNRKQAASPLGDFVDTFDNAAEQIRLHTQPNTDFHPKIIGDGSASTMWDMHHWQDIKENTGLTFPTTLTAHLLKHITPNVKIIAIVRNPTERLYSDYKYFNENTSPEMFHERASHSVKMMTECIKNSNIRECAYNRSYATAPSTRLEIGMYSLYIRDWLDVFQKNQVMIFRLEDYSENREKVLNQMCLFLDIDPMPESKDINNLKVSNKGAQEDGDMFPETREMLDKFYAPFNEELADIMAEPAFAYSDW